jgi:hypothetical protein
MKEIKKDPAKDIDAEVEFTCPCGKTTNLDYIIKNERRVIIDSLLESGLLEEKKDCENCNDCEAMMSCPRKEGHNTLARAVKELISKMNSV